MAKRRKLEAPDPAELAAIEEDFAGRGRPDRLGLSSMPIASVAAETARMVEPGGVEQRVTAARDGKDAAAWREAVEEGRVVHDIAIAKVVDNHLIRDRMVVERAELDELVASIRANGQRLPIEVTDLGGGRYGLISGWRRLAALSELAQEGHPATARAIVRSATETGSAYAAMVEENEVRAQLTPYERGRIAVVAADQGAFRSTEDAVDAIFATASKAKRSKIRSFALIHEELGDMLTFPADLSERNGLALATALRAGQSDRLRQALATGLGTDPTREWGLLAPIVTGQGQATRDPGRGGRPKQEVEREPLANGITMEKVRHEDGYAIRLRGRVVDDDLVETVMAEVRRLLEPI